MNTDRSRTIAVRVGLLLLGTSLLIGGVVAVDGSMKLIDSLHGASQQAWDELFLPGLATSIAWGGAAGFAILGPGLLLLFLWLRREALIASRA